MRAVSFDVGVLNLAFVVAEIDGPQVRVLSWRNVRVAESAKAPKQELVCAVLRALSEHDDLLECGTVLIESQPRFSPLNVHVAHAIASFFWLRKRIDLDEAVDVHFVHASLKNTYCSPHAGERKRGVTARYAKYDAYKRGAVSACEALVAGTALEPTWRAFKKRDDAADCLMQLLAWRRVPFADVRLSAP
jgi:hypothetical protein